MTDTRPAQSGAAVYKGPLGQTQRRSVTVTGQHGDTFEAMIFSQINVTESPHMRAELATGKLTSVNDPDTGQPYALALPLLYHNEALRLFALVLPDALRHDEFRQRAALLEQLAEQGPLPRYVREFKVIFGHENVAAAETMTPRSDVAQQAPPPPASRGAAAPPPSPPKPPLKSSPSRSMPAVPAPPAPPPAKRLDNLKTRLQSADRPPVPLSPPSRDNEPTTVVPREVFYGLTDAAQANKDTDTSWGTEMESGWDVETPPSPTNLAKVNGGPRAQTPSNDLPVADNVPRVFNRLKAGSRPFYHTLTDGNLLLSYRLDETRMRRFTEIAPRLFFQFHDLTEFPLITILLAALDDEENIVDDLYWPLDVRKPGSRNIIEVLSGKFNLRTALYGDDLKLRQVISFSEPLEFNAHHILGLAQARLEQGHGLSFDDALRRIEAPDYERLGSMRHNFHEHSFNELDSPSQVKLAAGIVGYWSGPETFRYLIENRSFSLRWFGAIQERVARGAARFGIALAPELRRVAIELGLANDDVELTHNLAATWAQVELGVGARNDLDPLETWDNWQGLIETLEAHDQALNDELAELARAALRRAQSYAEDNDLLSAFPDGDAAPLTFDGDTPSDPDSASLASSDLAMRARSELGDIEEEELKALLVDDEKRLMAAVQLLERGHPDALIDVLMATERMEDDDLEHLSERLSITAPRLEEALLECLELDNPTTAYLCAFALASIPSDKARAALIDALQDPERAPDTALFVETLLPYGAPLAETAIDTLADADSLDAQHPLVVLLRELHLITDGDAILDMAQARAPLAAPHLNA